MIRRRLLPPGLLLLLQLLPFLLSSSLVTAWLLPLHQQKTPVTGRGARRGPLLPHPPRLSSPSLHASRVEVIDDPAVPLPVWRRMGDAQVAFPPDFATPVGVIHFIGGQVVGTVPKAAYGPFIEKLAKAGFCVVATPIPFTLFDHESGAAEAVTIFEEACDELIEIYGPRLLTSVPIFGIGHSLGAKMQVLLGCYRELSGLSRPRANVFISFNNFSARESVPLLTELKNLVDKVTKVKDVDVIQKMGELGDLSKVIKALDVLSDGKINTQVKKGIDMAMNFVMGAVSTVPTDYRPSPEETWERARTTYGIRSNLVIQFSDDNLDQSSQLLVCLKTRFSGSDTVRLAQLKGTHITPNTPDESILRDLELSKSPAYPGARGGADELAATWFREAGVDDISRQAAARARQELESLVNTVVDYLKEMASRPDTYGELPQ